LLILFVGLVFFKIFITFGNIIMLNERQTADICVPPQTADICVPPSPWIRLSLAFILHHQRQLLANFTDVGRQALGRRY